VWLSVFYTARRIDRWEGWLSLADYVLAIDHPIRAETTTS